MERGTSRGGSESLPSRFRESYGNFPPKITAPLSKKGFKYDHLLGKYPKIMEIILNGIRKRYHSRSIEIDEALYQKALKGDPRAIELWYRKLEAWSPNPPPEGGTTIRIIFGSGFPDEEVIEVKRGGPTEIVGDEKEGPAFELPEENRD
jgi:hypothetical protein